MLKIYLNIFLVSASVICFEIVSTRISSVIFVNDYAFIILSLSILGLGIGGIYSYYKINIDTSDVHKILFRTLVYASVSTIVFICAVILLNITNPFLFLLTLILPFFFSGIVYAQIFKIYSDNSFKLYASDLCGAALGSILSIFIFNLFGANNSILFISLLILGAAGFYLSNWIKKKPLIIFYSIISVCLIFLIINGNKSLIGEVPIGNFPEKDFYNVYPNAVSISDIIESRWSLYGRADLVQYRNQDLVKQLFIDGSAGTQMYRFNGDKNNPDQILYNLLIQHSSSIPFFLLNDSEKNNMLVIGPGGGKEVLTALLFGVDKITGVEINPDFVSIVREYKDFNGGIYTDFPNVDIIIKEGRHFIKQSDEKYDLIIMALPSTEQLQNIDNFAMSENYLLTVEAIQDYFKILTEEGYLIVTIHNRWELFRLIITAMYSIEKMGINHQNALNHFAILEMDYAPTIMIKKNAFTKNEINDIEIFNSTIPKGLPTITFLPDKWGYLNNSIINRFLKLIKNNQISLEDYINQGQYDISPCRDDNPYFYKVNRGVPENYSWLVAGVAFFNLLSVGIPLSRIKKNIKKNKLNNLLLPLIVIISIAFGFMILEVSLFQKFVLYLGSPTISLSILLGSLLVGMGTGSFFGKKIFINNLFKRLSVINFLIFTSGVILILSYPIILNELLAYSLWLRSVICFFMILPFGFLLGIPFPTAIQLLKEGNMEKYIPWMYGVSGTMSVFGSVTAVILSMLFGFTLTFIVGLSLYLLVFLVIIRKSNLKIVLK